jgi:tetratricopeptide (TPR) repeat protein
MNEDRIKILQKHIEESPLDPFPKYALALEYLDDQPDLSVPLFKQLLEENPDYLPTYYQAANLFASLSMNELAEQTFQKGIELSKDDLKTLAELKNAYQNFQFELE